MALACMPRIADMGMFSQNCSAASIQLKSGEGDGILNLI
jgi:hypothetical protein